MFTLLSPSFKEFKQLNLFDPKKLIEKLNHTANVGGFSFHLESAEPDLREPHWIGDREVHTRAQYGLIRGNSEFGDALYETGVIGRNPEKEEIVPYFESLILRTDIPIHLTSGKTIPKSTIKILLIEQPYQPNNIHSRRTDRIRVIGNLGWMRTYEIKAVLPTSDFVSERYSAPQNPEETFNHIWPIA